MVYIDLDGVLVNFNQGLTKICRKLLDPSWEYSYQRYVEDPVYKKQTWDTIKQYQQQGNKFWLNLLPMDDAYDLWGFLTQSNLNPIILTATGHSDRENTTNQKRQWVERYLGEKTPIYVVQSAVSKVKYSKPGEILIDDQDNAINSWKTGGGTGILHTSAKDTIKQLKDILG